MQSVLCLSHTVPPPPPWGVFHREDSACGTAFKGGPSGLTSVEESLGVYQPRVSVWALWGARWGGVRSQAKDGGPGEGRERLQGVERSARVKGKQRRSRIRPGGASGCAADLAESQPVHWGRFRAKPACIRISLQRGRSAPGARSWTGGCL